MIFVCLGTKRFYFNRLLSEIDELIENGTIEDEVFAQIGSSDYIPRNYKYQKFLDSEEYQKKLNLANIVITHGGTGAIVKALKANKKVIAVPRLKKFNEHSDDHQLQIVEVFNKQNLIYAVLDIKDLGSEIKLAEKTEEKSRFKSNGEIVNIIDDFILK